jgi:MFS family permease
MDQKGDQIQSGRGAGPNDVTAGTPAGSVPGAVVGATPTRGQMIIFWASFMTLIAGGIGFTVRNALLASWGKQFAFTQFELGQITGAGLWGFPIAIIGLSFIVDRVGYGKVMVVAFVLHVLSAVVTLAATPVFQAVGNKDGAYWCLYLGSWIFSLANGACESVINPLTATLFPRNKTHWLNVLHAGWPGGLILGALLMLGFSGLSALDVNIRWEVQMAMFIIPVLIYGGMMLGRRFPHSEAKAAGVGLGVMILEFASPILLFLILLHAMVGYVELGTDSWITNIEGTILANPVYGLILFAWTSGLMFVLRFCAGPIVHRISPLGLLCCAASIACVGLLMLGLGPNLMLFCILAVTVYGLGKTFFWPTMLGVVSERFPKGGALTLGVVGGVGMLSAGLLGGPLIGYEQDYFARQSLISRDDAAYQRYSSETPNEYLGLPPIHGLDNTKLGILDSKGKTLDEDVANLKRTGQDPAKDNHVGPLLTWWYGAGTAKGAQDYAKSDLQPITDSRLDGGKMALTWTAVVPLCMAVGYLILILYFWSRGGYQAQVLLEHKANDEQFTGGVEGPADL